MLDFMQENAKKIIRDFVRVSYNKIDVKPGKCRYNYRCHDNSVHEAIDNNWGNVAMLATIRDGCPYVHFVNVVHGDTYVDNTLGHHTTSQEHFLVKYIPEDEFDDIHYYHTQLKNHLLNQVPWWVKIFSDHKL